MIVYGIANHCCSCSGHSGPALALAGTGASPRRAGPGESTPQTDAPHWGRGPPATPASGSPTQSPHAGARRTGGEHRYYTATIDKFKNSISKSLHLICIYARRKRCIMNFDFTTTVFVFSNDGSLVVHSA